MAQYPVHVVSGTGAAGIQQVNVTGASGPYPQWTQVTGPTGGEKTVQAINTGPSGGQEIKTVQIVGYKGPA